MAKAQDLKIQKALTAELKKQREILAAHTKESKNYKDSVKKIQEIVKKRAEANKRIAEENKRVSKQEKQLGVQMQRNLSTQVDLNNAGKTAVIGAKNLSKQQKTISALIDTDLDQRADLSSIMIDQVKSANDLNDAQLKIGTTLFDNSEIEKQLADQLTGIEQKRLDIMTGRIALGDTEKADALAVLDAQEQQLNIQKDISKFQGMQNDAVNDLQKPMTEIKDKAMQLGATLKAALANPALILIAGLGAAAGQMFQLFKGAQSLKTELGISDEAAVGLQMQISEVSLSMKAAGVESADVAEAQMALINNFGGVAASSTDLLMNMAQLKADFGVSGNAAGALMVTMKAIGASSEQAAMEMAKNVASLAQAEGVAPGQVMQDIANNTEAFAGFAKDGGMNVAKAAIEAKKLGINFDTAVKIADNLLDFESSIQQQMEAEILLGRQLNLDKARQLALSGDIEGLQREVLKNVGTEAEFNNMNVLQRRALAESIGVSVDELSRLASGDLNVSSDAVEPMDAVAEGQKMLSDAMGGVDTGAWILGKAGLLEGKSATTHWEDLEDFADYFRQTKVQPDRFVIDKDIITIGGASPTFDFMLHLIRSRIGYPAALEVASVFVYDETHFSTDAQPLVSLGLLNDFEPRVTKAIRIMESSLDEPIAVTSVAKKLNISSRRLENLFQQHLQTTPGAYYLNLRLLRARKYVTDTLLPMQEIAIRTGFNSLSSFSRSFKQSYHNSPSAYRQK